MIGILTYTQIVTLDLSRTIYAAWSSVCLSIPFSTTNSKMISFSINLKSMLSTAPSPSAGILLSTQPRKTKKGEADFPRHRLSHPACIYIFTSASFLPQMNEPHSYQKMISVLRSRLSHSCQPMAVWFPLPFLIYHQNVYFPLCTRSWASVSWGPHSSFMALDTIHGPETSEFASLAWISSPKVKLE